MLNKQITVIVPSKTKNNKSLPLQKNSKECLKAMGNIFGGATSSNIQNGCFVMHSGKMMFEKSVSITSYCQAGKDLTEFFKFVVDIKHKYNQECIAVIINNEMQFV